MVKCFTHYVEEKRNLNAGKIVSSCGRGGLLYTPQFSVSLDLQHHTDACYLNLWANAPHLGQFPVSGRKYTAQHQHC